MWNYLRTYYIHEKELGILRQRTTREREKALWGNTNRTVQIKSVKLDNSFETVF